MAAIKAKSSPFQNSASSPYFTQAWTTTTANYDIVASGPAGGSEIGYACRRITVGVAGTLVVTDLASGTARTLTCIAGEVLDIEATYLNASSTAQNVKVFW